mgnify:CR=1 FL=1
MLFLYVIERFLKKVFHSHIILRELTNVRDERIHIQIVINVCNKGL